MQDLYHKAIALPYSQARVDAIKDGIRQADQLNETEYGYLFRMELVEDAAYDGRYSDVRDAFGAMGWIFKKFDDGLLDDIDIFEFDLIDMQQWICRWLALYPEITLQQFDNLLDDLRKRLLSAGYQLQAYYEAKMMVSLLTDQRSAADEAYQLYRAGKKDAFNTCDDCIACRRIKYLRYIGNHSAAFKEAKALEWPGGCNMNPKTAYNELVASAVESGNYEGIALYQKRAYKMIMGDPFFLNFIGYHMQYYANTNPAEGLKLYEKHKAWLGGHNRFPLALYDFHMGAAVLVRKLADETLAGEHYEAAAEIAKKFDERNQTSYYSEKLERLYRAAG
ncbi:MAG: hypothetical protein LBV04_03360 [Deferribacteraceae bacterium]|jgi:hypothetical protein|nr:hypothetical protein [Deferribacteraceae bacterium]